MVSKVQNNCTQKLVIQVVTSIASVCILLCTSCSPEPDFRKDMIFNKKQQDFIDRLVKLHVDNDIVDQVKDNIRYDDDHKLTQDLINHFLAELTPIMNRPVTTVPPAERRPETFISSRRDDLESWENALRIFSSPLSEEDKRKSRFETEQREADIQAVHESSCRTSPWMNSCQ